MKLENASITLLINSEYTTIELKDNDSCIIFAEITLTSQQLSDALSRLGNTKCEIDVFGLDKLGKKREMKEYTFELPPDYNRWEDPNNEKIMLIAMEQLPEEDKDWVINDYFGSQRSFSHDQKTNKKYGRTHLVRWVKQDEKDK